MSGHFRDIKVESSDLEMQRVYVCGYACMAMRLESNWKELSESVYKDAEIAI